MHRIQAVGIELRLLLPDFRIDGGLLRLHHRQRLAVVSPEDVVGIADARLGRHARHFVFTVLLPVLQALLSAYPFSVQGFHSDNGSEYINHQTANLLNQLHIGQFTKSRPRHSNDNALVEGKNAAVVRKCLGYAHIPKRFAHEVNHFTQNVLSPVLELPPPLPLPRRSSRPQRPHQKTLRGSGRHHPLRKAQVPAPRHPVSQTPPHLRKTRRPRLCHLRPRCRPSRQ